MNTELIIYFKNDQEYIRYIGADDVVDCNKERIKFTQGSTGKVDYYLMSEINSFEIKQVRY